MLFKNIKLGVSIFLASIASVIMLPSSALAHNQETVQAFYDFLSNPGSQVHADKFRESTNENWESIGDYSGKSKTREQFIGQLGGFSKLVPDLKWEVVEMIRDGDRVVVRGRATGTPMGPLFGVDGKGKSFDIMSIDIHTLKRGKIVTTYHIEDWAGALRQLSAQ